VPLLPFYLFRAGLICTTALLAAASVIGQTTGEVATQIWANVTLDDPRGDRALFELDFEPKTQIAPEGETWRNLDVTPLVEYYPNRWLDLEAELAVGRTHQFEGVDTWEVTPRVGFRLNLLSSLRERAGGPIVSEFGRFKLATLVRFERRNFFYGNGEPSSHEWRFRTRLESKVGINHVDLSLDRTLYAIADAEVFLPLGSDISERFASKARIRCGLGYRIVYGWRAEVLYIRDSNRATPDDPFGTSTNALDARVKVFF
jgi:uncharacterized protein DUF2490